MRVMLANMLPWAEFRRTYGQPIETRELVKRRIARLAGLIAGSRRPGGAGGRWLIDQGYRGELECIIAKIFGSEAQKEAAIELFMKTHGGRSFLHGHIFGDNVHEFLAPCIYEGEGEMLGMAFFKSLVKEHGKQFFEPIGKAFQAAGIGKPNLINPRHAWIIAPRAVGLHALDAGPEVRRPADGQPCPAWTAAWRSTSPSPRTSSARSAGEISAAMDKHQLKLADRQCRMAELSQPGAGHDHHAGDGAVRAPGRRRGRRPRRRTSSARTCAAS